MASKIIKVTGFWLYIFLLGGLFLNTALDTPDIFGKYTWRQFVIIVIALIIAPLYFLIIGYLAKSSTYQIGKRSLKFSPVRKIFIVLATILISFIVADQIMRIGGIKQERSVYSMDFHPFLQQKNRRGLTEDAYHNNSFGFRGDEITKEKPKGTYRIVILGGSTAYGVLIPYSQSAPKLLEDRLRKHYETRIEVINAGVPWYTSQHSIIDYMFRISDFQPDLIIMWHGVNDMYAGCPDPSNPTARFEPDYSHILGPLGNMVNSYFDPPPITIHLLPLDYVTKFSSRHLYTDITSYKDRFIEVVHKRLSPSMTAEDIRPPSLTSYKRNLKRLINLVRDDNAQLILANQPNMFSTLEKYKMSKVDYLCYDGKRKTILNSITGIEKFNNATKKIASENDVPFIDLNSVLPKTPEYFADAFHWSTQGHIVAAENLYNFIVNGNFIPE